MSRSVVFNGITRFTAGGIVKVNTDALNQVSFTAPNIIALVGESDGGAPGSAGIIKLRDPSKAAATFRAGPLVDAIVTAFQASGDSRIPGGASEVYVYKTNTSTQSSVHVPDPANALLRDTASAGSTATTVNMTATLTASALVDRWASVAINGLPLVAAITTTALGTKTTAIKTTTADAYVGQMIQFGAATATPALQGEYAVVIANDGTTFTFDHELPAVVASGDQFDVINTKRVKVVSNSTSAITVTPALPASPASGDGVYIHPTLFVATTKDYGLHTASTTLDILGVGSAYKLTVAQDGSDQSSENLGGSNVFQLVYTGGGNAVAADTVTTPTTTTATVVAITTGGLTVAAHAGATVVITDPASGISEQHKLATNAAASVTLESPGLSPDFLATIIAATTATVIVEIKTVTAATAVVTGASGKATTLTTTLTGVTGDDLALAISATESLQELADAVNANSNYTASVPSGVNGALLASELDFSAHSTFNIQKGIAVNGGLGVRRDLQEVINWFVANSEFVTAVRHATDTTDGGALVDAVLNESTFLEPLKLSGGARGSSTNSSFQAAFDALLLEKEVALVVPLIDENLSNEGLGSTATWASVAAQLASHVTLARGIGATERGGHLGFRGTKTALVAAANALNDKDVQLCSQQPTILDSTGTLVQFGPRMQAVMAASMRAGVSEVGEPLTHKYLRVSALTQDSSWDPTDATDAADLIKAGVLFAVVIPGKGTRWERDLTTWVKDDNLACSEGSVRSIVRTVAKGIRETLDDRYTGRKASPTTVGSVRDTLATLLNLYRTEGLIVDSTDPTTGATIRAWHSLKVFTDGDVLRVNVGIFPVPGINFELTEIFVQLPSQSAA